MSKPGKSMIVILALVAAVVLAGISQAFASEVLFNFGPPTQNINGYPLIEHPNRSNGAPSPEQWASGTTPAPTISDTNYRIAGDSFTIGTTGQHYHIDHITLYILYGAAGSATDHTITLANPQTNGVPLNLLAGQVGDINTVASSYTATRI
jgi:hypothetical protein